MARRAVETALGRFTVEVEGGAVARLRWGGAGDDEGPLLDEAAAQLADWAAGRRDGFDLPLAPASGLAAAVRAAMLAIPLGETRTYGEIAARVGAPAQAVGQACGANPIPVIVPCHRVVGAAGLGGFSAPGGAEAKVRLLRRERAYGLLI